MQKESRGWSCEGVSYEVVGVAESVRNVGLDLPAHEQVYLPIAQTGVRSASYVLLTQGPPGTMVPEVRAALRERDASLPIYDVRTMEDRLGQSIAPKRLSTLLVAGFAGTAMLLAAIGIYGVIAYSVRQSTREIGIRVALGARRGQVFRLVIGQGMVLAVAGLALGAAGAMATTRLLGNMLFEISPRDPGTFAAAASLLAATALLACWLPARRAMRVDPASALRHE